MKLTISETTTKEVELILPCWRKTDTSYYYITEDQCIEVMDLDEWVYVGRTSSPSAQAINDSKAITYEEFWEAYEKAIKKLYEKIKAGVRYEFQINEGSIYIDEIVNGKANRQFVLKLCLEWISPMQEITLWHDNRHGDTNEDHIMLEEYAMFHQNKWEEVPE